MKDYKETLWMLKTPFEMRGNLGQREPFFQKKWEELDLYHRVMEKNKDRTPYILHDGPPYANGPIHVGHAFQKTLKDFVLRYRNMSGFCASYIPGWDTHGLPIETAVTKSGVNRKEKTTLEFRKICYDYAVKQVALQREGFQRLGVLGDYDHAYITYQPEFEAEQVRVFAKMVQEGLIYKGLRPVYWSPSSESALAEAEIEYIDKEDISIYVAMPIVNGTGLLEDTFAVIWTTTPWTIPANLAISAGPEIVYVIVKVRDKKYLVAKELLENLVKEFSWDQVDVLGELKGNDLLNVQYRHPLFGRVSPIIVGEHVTTTDGTGLVHTAPGHGEDDFNVGKEYHLDVLCPVDGKGVMTKEAFQYEGLFYEACNAAVIHDLLEGGYLLKQKKLLHSYPHDWRTKKPIIFRATPQWFASIAPIKDQLLSEIQKVEWVPKWGETRLFNMMKDRNDWCISRQRVWGVPIPIFYAEDETPILEDVVLQRIANIFEKQGSNAWFELEAKALLPEGFSHPGSPNGIFRKETDIMDVWFDSGTSYTVIERQGYSLPVDLYLEGSDQFRGWFNSSLTTSVATRGLAPYKTCVTHGFVMDGEGRKMSKSLGNVVDPNKVFKELGADIFRLWVASVEYNVDVRISDELLKQVAESYRKIRNTVRFLLANIADFTPSKDSVSFDKLNEVDQYLLLKLNKVVEKVHQAYLSFNFSDVLRTVLPFISNELSAFYLDFTKDILYIEEKDGHTRRAVQTVLYEVLDALLKMLTPMIPHTTSEAYDFMPEKTADDVYLTDMPAVKDLSHFQTVLEKWDRFMEYRDSVLKALEEARNEKVIGKSFNAHLKLTLDAEAKALFDSLQGDIRQILIVSQMTITLGDTFQVTIEAAQGETCSRCWQIVPHIDEEELCPRCNTIVKGYPHE